MESVEGFKEIVVILILGSGERFGLAVAGHVIRWPTSC